MNAQQFRCALDQLEAERVPADLDLWPRLRARLLRMFEPEVSSQGQPLNLSQTIDSVTVSVEWAYADAGHVRIGYTMRSSDGRRFDPADCRLVDGAGTPMPFTMGYGVTGRSDILDVALPAGEGSYVAVFANEAPGSAPGETLKLRLEMQAEELILPTPSQGQAGSPAAGPAGAGSVLLEPLPVGAHLGPFTFEFSIPVMAASQ